jgi:pilus assembly protein CpaF
LSRVIGWKVAAPVAAKEAAGEQGTLRIAEHFEFSALEEAVFAKASAEYAAAVESSRPATAISPAAFERIVADVCTRHRAGLGAESASRVANALMHSFCGFGCLDFLLCRDDLEEIAFVSTAEPLYVFSSKKKCWLATNCFLCSERFAMAAVNRMASKSGRRLSFATPRLDSQLANGGRLHATCPPISPAGVSFSIRLFPARRMDMADLVSAKAICADAAAFLWFAMQSDCSIIVAGNTGGGKTTVLNALCDLVGTRERLVLVEDTPELQPSQKHVARLVASKAAMADLVKDTLRMRPDRVFVGEVRTAGDCKALFDCLLSGQARGTYCTFHSDSADECLARMRLMGATDHDLAALDLIIVARRIPVYDLSARTGGEVRRVTEICEVRPENGSYVPKPVFSFDAEKSALRFCGFGDGKLKEKIMACLSNAGDGKFALEWQKRARFFGKTEPAAMALRAEKYLYA